MIPDRWLVLTASCRDGDRWGFLAEGLLALGGRAVEERGAALVTYLPPPEDPEGFVRDAARFLEARAGVRGLRLSWGWQPHQDWSETWKRGLAPRRISPRLVVAPSWHAVKPSPGEVVLSVDPGIAFGTAEHATTRGCLRLLDRAVSTGESVADVGSGSGILAVAAARLGAREVLALEADAFAVASARSNADANGVALRVRVVHRRVDAGSLSALGPFDGIVSNIESGVLISLLPGLTSALRAGGWLVLGGILEEECPAFRERVGQAGLETVAEDLEDGWWSVWLRRGAPGHGG